MKKLFTFILALVAGVGTIFATQGALSGKFTINANGDQVVFSKGNLQASTTDLGEHWTWSFAEQQWNAIGKAPANNAITDNGKVSTNGTVDLFGWSTASTYYGIHSSTTASDYAGEFVDWGTIIGNGWYTLSCAEWTYLFTERTDASSKYGMATVADVHGVIILPDIYEGTAINSDHNAWANNTISASDWAAYEAAGAVFLPAMGYRYGTNVNGVGAYGDYQSSTPRGEDNASYVDIAWDRLSTTDGGNRNTGRYVRLVQKYVETNTYYVTGNGGTGNPWCDGMYWSPNGSLMENNTITFENVPAGIYEFKITDGQWGEGHEWAFGAVDATCSSANVFNGGDGATGNIKLITSVTQDITITFDGTHICVTGTFDDPSVIVILNYTIVGDSRLVGSAWNVGDNSNDMTQLSPGIFTLTKNKRSLVAGANYEYKVVGNHDYAVYQLPAHGNNEISVAETGDYDVVFTLNVNENPNTLTAVATKATEDPTAISDVQNDHAQCAKVIRNGQLFIRRGNELYNAQGARVK